MAPSYAAAGQETCQGQPATLVVAAGQTVAASEGADVIVVQGLGAEVDALGGDDTICIVEVDTVIHAGAGNDVVVTDGSSVHGTGEGDHTTVDLGPGADRYQGDSMAGYVSGGDAAGDLERDEISTGAGFDVIVSGTPGVTNADVIHTGDGNDAVSFTPLDPSGVLDVGPGDNVATLMLEGSVPTLGIDVPAQTLGVGSTVHPWTGPMHKWVVDATAAPGLSEVVFRGSSERERFELSSVSRPRVTVTTEGRNDSVSLTGQVAPNSTVSLGRDRDTLSLLPRSWDEPVTGVTVTADLSRQVFAYGEPAGTAVMTGVEKLAVHAATVRLTGDDRDDWFVVSGCDVRVRGAGGRDTVNSYGIAGCRQDIRLVGGPGSDRLHGDWFEDVGDEVILGGPGDDYLDGGLGDDVLRAGSGHDRLSGGTGADTLAGGPGPDILHGTRGDDALTGGAGDDLLDGGSGDDILDGGPGRDHATGGPDVDTCRAEKTQGCELLDQVRARRAW